MRASLAHWVTYQTQRIPAAFVHGVNRSRSYWAKPSHSTRRARSGFNLKLATSLPPATTVVLGGEGGASPRTWV